jgi:hypothetical protein
MASQIYGRALFCAAALALAGCVSTTPSPDSTTAQANLAVATNHAVVSEASAPLGTADKSLKPGNGYRKITKNGETYFCKKELATGSRTNAQVNCLTQDEMAALSQKGQDLLNGIRGVPGAQSGPLGPGGGTMTSAVSQ